MDPRLHRAREDGPTHQPVEHLAALRAIPGLDVVRPGDANETTACWCAILGHHDRLAGPVLSRQNLPVLDRGRYGCASADLAARVVSMPCREWFSAQPLSYQDEVLPPAVRARVSVEAGTGQGWRDVVGDGLAD